MDQELLAEDLQIAHIRLTNVKTSVVETPGAGASQELSHLSQPSFFFELSQAVGLVPLSQAKPSQ